MQQDPTQNLTQGQSPVNSIQQTPVQSGSNSTQSNQLDPTIVNMARAIKSVETSGSSDPYTAQGKSGEYGAYQYTAPTWNADSQKYLGQAVPLTQASVAQQNEVAYKKIADLKAHGCNGQGCNPSQVASIWNYGKPDPTGNVGTNNYGVAYNTPQYVQSVVSAYNNFKNGNNTPPQPTASTVDSKQNTSPQSTGLLGQLQNRGSDIANNLGDIVNQTQGQKGSQHWWSDLLQSAGDVAGGVGDVINAGLNLIPGVKQGEDWVGGQVAKAADTKVGQAITGAIQDFQQKNPELSKDIGAGLNIATLIPIFKGLGAVKDVVGSGLGTALKDVASKGISKELVEQGTTGLKPVKQSFLDNGGENTINAGLKEGFAPGIEGGKYVSGDASEVQQAIKSHISNIDETQLQPILNKVAQNQSIGQNLTTLKKKVIDELKNLPDESDIKRSGTLPEAISQVEKRFAGWQFSYGDNIKLDTENIMKRGTGVFTQWDTPEHSADKVMYGVLQNDIENTAKLNGFPVVHDINEKMGSMIKYGKFLKSLDGKKIKIGLLSKVVGKVGRVGFAKMAGAAFPGAGLVPEALGYMGSRGLENTEGTFAKQLRRGLLEKSFKKPSKIAPKSLGLIGSALETRNQR